MDKFILFIFLIAVLIYIYMKRKVSFQGGGSGRKVIKSVGTSYIKLIDNTLYCYNGVDKQKIGPDTEFRIASITKLFVTICILIQQKRGLLNIDDKISKYIDYDFGTITIRELLNHTSGLKKNFVEERLRVPPEAVQGFTNATRTLNYYIKKGDANLTPDPALRGKDNYCNIGFLILGAIIEKTSGMDWGNFLEKNITRPLNMKHTAVGNPKTIMYHRGKPLNTSQLDEIKAAAASGDMHSTINDLETFARKLWSLSFDHEVLKEIVPLWWNNALVKNGGMPGAKAIFAVQYDDDNNMKHINIWLSNAIEDRDDVPLMNLKTV